MCNPSFQRGARPFAIHLCCKSRFTRQSEMSDSGSRKLAVLLRKRQRPLEEITWSKSDCELAHSQPRPRSEAHDMFLTMVDLYLDVVTSTQRNQPRLLQVDPDSSYPVQRTRCPPKRFIGRRRYRARSSRQLRPFLSRQAYRKKHIRRRKSRQHGRPMPRILRQAPRSRHCQRQHLSQLPCLTRCGKLCPRQPLQVRPRRIEHHPWHATDQDRDRAGTRQR